MKAVLVVCLIVFLSPLSLLLMNRGQAADVFVFLYESISGKKAEVVSTPFTDIQGNKHSVSIAKLYALKITAGTSATTYSPDNRLEIYQLLIFAGRTFQKIKEAAWLTQR